MCWHKLRAVESRISVYYLDSFISKMSEITARQLSLFLVRCAMLNMKLEILTRGLDTNMNSSSFGRHMTLTDLK